MQCVNDENIACNPSECDDDLCVYNGPCTTCVGCSDGVCGCEDSDEED